MRNREEVERELSIWKDRYRWAMEDVSKADNKIDKLKKELEELPTTSEKPDNSGEASHDSH